MGGRNEAKADAFAAGSEDRHCLIPHQEARMRSADDRTAAVPDSDSAPSPEGKDPNPRSIAVPPILDPERFDHFEGLRETTLVLFTEPRANQALRVLGDLLYTLAAESSQYWPRGPEGSLRYQCRAAVADLRHLQGYLTMLGHEIEASELTDPEADLSRICGRLAPQVQEIADALETELNTGRNRE
jgi:hypothetical protein